MDERVGRVVGPTLLSISDKPERSGLPDEYIRLDEESIGTIESFLSSTLFGFSAVVVVKISSPF
jgi:hypothetical protein